MDLEKLRKQLEELNAKETLTDLEVNQKQMLEALIEAEEKKIKDADDTKVAEEAAKKLALEEEAKKSQEKLYDQKSMTKVREEAKANRIKFQEQEKLNKELMEQLKLVDLEEYARLKENEDKIKKEQEDAELERRKKEGEFDQLLAEARAAEEEKFKMKEVDYLNDLEKRKNEIDRLVEENDNLAYDKEFNKALQEAGVGVEDPLGLKLRLEREQALETTEEGQKVIVLKDFDTKTIMLDDSGKPLSMAERVKQLRDDPITAYMFTSDREGAGSFTKSEGKKPTPKGNVEDIEYFRKGKHYSTEKQREINLENPEKYNALVQRALLNR